MKNVKKKGKNNLEMVKTVLLAIIARYKKRAGAQQCAAHPPRG